MVVFRLDLKKMEMLSAERTRIGKLFHNWGARTVNDLTPYLTFEVKRNVLESENIHTTT